MHKYILIACVILIISLIICLIYNRILKNKNNHLLDTLEDQHNIIQALLEQNFETLVIKKIKKDD